MGRLGPLNRLLDFLETRPWIQFKKRHLSVVGKTAFETCLCHAEAV